MSKTLAVCLVALSAFFLACSSAVGSDGSRFVAENDVTWTTLGADESDSMPIGNGDFAVNVWTEQNGDLVLLVAKSDAWTETGKLVKLGRLRIRLDPNPFKDTSDFTQTLKLETGAIEIRCGQNNIRVWTDANRPAMHVEGRFALATTMHVSLELWRTNISSSSSPSPERGGLFEFGGHPPPVDFEPDTVLAARTDSLAWCHFNIVSIYPEIFREEHLAALLNKYPDPLLHRCFGGMLTGPGLVSEDDENLKSASPARDLRLDLYALTETDVLSPDVWRQHLNALADECRRVNISRAWKEHRQWWDDFWNRSWIHLSGTSEASQVSQGYVMQRYMMTCSSRGPEPVKFNGGLFTVGHDLPANEDSNKASHNPDFREWGSSYWNQNTRLLYWPLMASGDEDLLTPWFNMYLKALPLAEDRTRLYYHHDGAAFVETMYFWGLPNLNDFGWDNPSNQLASEWMRYHVQGAVEVVAQMLDSYDYDQDQDFARRDMVPFAAAIVTWYDQHWPRDTNGKIRMSPSQSLETYQRDAVNPTPDIAGLMDVLPRLLALPHQLTSPEQRDLWSKVLHDLPPIAMGTTRDEKIPPFGIGDSNGAPVILPAEKYGRNRNVENPELYTVFPYRLYGMGKPDLALARHTFAARRFPFATCWGQDGTESAVLGLTTEAQKVAVSEFTDYGDQRFRWFWKAGGDWIPDLDNGGSGMITLQLMLMQCNNKQILLLPAWPRDWTADFKLNAVSKTIVEGHVANGRLTGLKVIPSSRARDVVILPVTE